MACFGLGKAERQAAAERDSQNREAVLSAQQAAAQLRQQLAASAKREEDLRREVAAHEDRQQELMQRLTEQEAELAGASELSAQQAQRIQSLEAECQATAGQILTLQQKLEGSSRQAKAMQTQVVELKAEVAKKLRQQEQLKSKYLKMQEAMKMLEEVVVCVVGGQPDMPPGGGPVMGGSGGRSAPGGARLAPLPAGSRAGQQPPSRMQQDRAGQDSLVAKRFSQLRQSANDLRLSFAALSAEAAAGERKLASQAPECVPENEENDDGPADQMCKVAPSHSLPETATDILKAP